MLRIELVAQSNQVFSSKIFQELTIFEIFRRHRTFPLTFDVEFSISWIVANTSIVHQLP